MDGNSIITQVVQTTSPTVATSGGGLSSGKVSPSASFLNQQNSNNPISSVAGPHDVEIKLTRAGTGSNFHHANDINNNTSSQTDNEDTTTDNDNDNDDASSPFRNGGKQNITNSTSKIDAKAVATQNGGGRHKSIFKSIFCCFTSSSSESGRRRQMRPASKQQQQSALEPTKMGANKTNNTNQIGGSSSSSSTHPPGNQTTVNNAASNTNSIHLINSAINNNNVIASVNASSGESSFSTSNSTAANASSNVSPTTTDSGGQAATNTGNSFIIFNTTAAALSSSSSTNNNYSASPYNNENANYAYSTSPDKPLLPPIRPGDFGKKCLIIDLDETLVHSSFKQVNGADFIVPVEIDGEYHQVYVLKRPFVDEFLKKMGELYECVLFTASLAKYADPVADLLDKWGVFRARLFRESCVYYRGNYVKDLSRLGRDLNKTIILDNSPASYIFHPDNAVPCASWFDDAHDTELLDLVPHFQRLAGLDSVYSVLRPGNNAAAPLPPPSPQPLPIATIVNSPQSSSPLPLQTNIQNTFKKQQNLTNNTNDFPKLTKKQTLALHMAAANTTNASNNNNTQTSTFYNLYAAQNDENINTSAAANQQVPMHHHHQQQSLIYQQQQQQKSQENVVAGGESSTTGGVAGGSNYNYILSENKVLQSLDMMMATQQQKLQQQQQQHI